MDYKNIYKILVGKGVINEDTPESFERFKNKMNTDSNYKALILQVYSPDDNTNQSAEGEAQLPLPTANDYNNRVAEYDELVRKYERDARDLNDYTEIYNANPEGSSFALEQINLLTPEVQSASAIIDKKREELVNASKAGGRRNIVNPDQWEGVEFSEEQEGDFLKGRWAWVNKLGGVGEWIDDFAMNWHQGRVTAQSVDDGMRALRKGAKMTDEDLTKLVEAWNKQHTVQQSNEVLKYHRDVEECGNTLLCAMKGFWKNPKVAPLVMASSLAMMYNPESNKAFGATLGASTLAGGAIGATGFLAGPTGILTTGGGLASGFSTGVPLAFSAGGGVLETAISFTEFLNEALDGKEFNEENIRAVLEDPTKYRHIKNRALKRGITIGAVEAITGSLARATGMRYMRSGAPTTTRRLTTITGQALGEMGGGAVGEFGGQIAGEQEINWSEIFLEGVAEGPMATFDYLSMMKQPSYDVKGQQIPRDEMIELLKTSTAQDILDLEIKIKGDPQLQKALEVRVKKAQVEKQINDASPNANYSREDLKELINIQEEITNLEGNTSIEADDRRKALKEKYQTIKSKYDAQEQGAVQETEGVEAGTSGEVAETDTQLRELTGQTESEGGVSGEVDTGNAEIVAESAFGSDSFSEIDTVENGIAIDSDGTKIVLATDGDALVVESVEVEESQQGQGRFKEAMAKIIEKADAMGIPIKLRAVSKSGKPQDTARLEKAYESMGFEKQADGMMYRAVQDKLIVRPNDNEVGITLNDFLEKQKQLTPEATPENVTVNGEQVSGDYVMSANDKVDLTKATIQEDTAIVMEDIRATLKAETEKAYRNSLHSKRYERGMTQPMRMRVLEKAKNMALKALKVIAPNVKIKLVSDPNEWTKVTTTTDNPTGDSVDESRGFWNPTDNVIYINTKNAGAREVAHEVFHAILIKKLGSVEAVEKATKAMVEALLPEVSGDMAQYLEEFAENYDANEKSEEKLSELFGIIAENYTAMSAKAKGIIRKFFEKIAKLFNLEPPATESDILALLQSLGRKVAEGTEIEESELSLIEDYAKKGDSKVQSTAPSSTNKKSKVRPIRTLLSDYLTTIKSEMDFDVNHPEYQAGVQKAIELNNDYELDLTPTGEKSVLFEKLMMLPEVDGDYTKAEMLKTKVYAPEFRSWFGDWLYAIKNDVDPDDYDMSKVVDKNGEPLLVYHGSQNMNDMTDISKTQDGGYHFSTMFETSLEFSPKMTTELKYGPYAGKRAFPHSGVGGFYLNIRHVYDIADLGGWGASSLWQHVKSMKLDQLKATYELADDPNDIALRTSKEAYRQQAFPDAQKRDKPIGDDWIDIRKREARNTTPMNVAVRSLKQWQRWSVLKDGAVEFFGNIDNGELNYDTDGFRYINVVEGPKTNENRAYIAFKPENIKSVHNSGEFGMEQPKFKRSKVSNQTQQIEGYVSDLTSPTTTEVNKTALVRMQNDINRGLQAMDQGMSIKKMGSGNLRVEGIKGLSFVPPKLHQRVKENLRYLSENIQPIDNAQATPLLHAYILGVMLDAKQKGKTRAEIFDNLTQKLPPVLTVRGFGDLSKGVSTKTQQSNPGAIANRDKSAMISDLTDSTSNTTELEIIPPGTVTTDPATGEAYIVETKNQYEVGEAIAQDTTYTGLENIAVTDTTLTQFSKVNEVLKAIEESRSPNSMGRWQGDGFFITENKRYQGGKEIAPRYTVDSVRYGGQKQFDSIEEAVEYMLSRDTDTTKVGKKSKVVRQPNGKLQFNDEIEELDTGIETTSWQIAGRVEQADITNLKRSVNNGMGDKISITPQEAQSLNDTEFNIFPEQDVAKTDIKKPVILVEMAGYPQYDSITEALESIDDPYTKLSDMYMIADGRHKLQKAIQQGKPLNGVIVSQGQFEASTGQRMLSEDMYRMMDDLEVGTVEEAIELLNNQSRLSEVDRLNEFGKYALSDEMIDIYQTDIAVEGLIVAETKIGKHSRISSKEKMYKENAKKLQEKLGDLENNLNNTSRFASDSSIRTNLIFKKKLDKRFEKALPKIRTRYNLGEDGNFRGVKPQDFGEGHLEYLTDAYVAETLQAISLFPSALGWYDRKIRVALSVLGGIYPELDPNSPKYNKDSEVLMKIALAITSNGLKVNLNFVEADKQYQHYLKHGKFSTEFGSGQAKTVMNQSFAFINKVLENMSVSDLMKFMEMRVRAGDLKYRKSDGSLGELASGFLADDVVFGSSILGPKIGNGYFMNLMGNFDTPTMDRWFYRQYARLTGQLIQRNEPKIAKHLKAIQRVVDKLKNPQSIKDPKARAEAEKTVRLLEEEMVDVSKPPAKGKEAVPKMQKGLLPNWRSYKLTTEAEAYKLAEVIEKMSANSEVRMKYMMGSKKNEKNSFKATPISTSLMNRFRLDGNNLAKSSRAEVEMPTAQERKVIDKAILKAQERLFEEHGIDISIADIQAVMWFPEKALYETFQPNKTIESGTETILKEERPDYEYASINLARKRGYQAWLDGDTKGVELSEPRVEVTEENKEEVDNQLRKNYFPKIGRSKINLDEVKNNTTLRDYLLQVEGGIQDRVDKITDNESSTNATDTESKRGRADEFYRTNEEDHLHVLRKRIIADKAESVRSAEGKGRKVKAKVAGKKSKVFIGKRALAEDVVQVGRNYGFTDAHLRMYMQEEKVKITDPTTGQDKWVRQFTDEQIEHALQVVIDVASVLPDAFADIEGGAVRGKVLYDQIISLLHDWAHTGPRGGKLRKSAKTFAEIRQKAYDLLQENPLYLYKDPARVSQLKHELLLTTDVKEKNAINREINTLRTSKPTRKKIALALDTSLGIKENANMRKKMSSIRRNLKGVKQGVATLQQLQHEMRMLVRQGFPSSVKGSVYTRSQVNSLMRRITLATEETIGLEVEKLFKVINSARNNEATRLMKGMLKLFKRRAKVTKSNSNRRINSGVMADDQTFYKQAVRVLSAIIKKDEAELNTIQEELDLNEQQIMDAFEKRVEGMQLTAKEQNYLALYDAFHTFMSLNNAELEQVIEMNERANLESTEALQRFAEWRLKISEQIEAMTEEANAEIENRWGDLVYLTKKTALKTRRLYNKVKREKVVKLVEREMGDDVYESAIVNLDSDTVTVGELEDASKGDIIVTPRFHKITKQLLGYDIHVVDQQLKTETDLSQSNRSIIKAIKESGLGPGMTMLWDKFKRNPLNIIRWGRSFQHIKTMTNMLDYGGTLFTDNIYRPLNQMYEKAMRIKHKNLRAINSILKNMTIDGKQINNMVSLNDYLVKKHGKVTFKGRKPGSSSKSATEFTHHLWASEMMRVYALSLNETQRDKLARSGYDQAKIDEIKDILGEDVIAFVDEVVEWLSEDHYIQVNEVYREVNNVNLPWIDNYFPTKSEGKFSTTDVVPEDFGKNFSAQSQSALKDRIDQTSEIVITSKQGIDFFSVLTTHVEDMSQFMGYAEGVAKMRRFFNIPSVIQMLRATNMGTMLRNSVNFSVNPRIGQSKLTPSTINTIQSKFTKLVLGYKLIQIPKQASSFVNAFAQYNAIGKQPENLLESLVKTPLDILGFAIDTAIVALTFPIQIKKGAEISATFAERLEQGFKGDMYSLASGTQAWRPMSKNKWRRRERKLSASPTIIGDVLGVLGYMAVYNADIRNGMSQQEAVERFNNYNETQQSRRPQDMAPIQQNTNFMERVGLMFMSTFMLQLNKVMQSASNFARGKSKPSDVRELALNAGIANVFFILASNIFKILWGDDEDKQEVLEEAEKGLLLVKMLNTIPFFGAELERWVDMYAYDKESWFKRSGVDPIARTSQKFLKGLQKEDGKWKDVDKLEEGVAEAIGLALGFNFDPWIGLMNYYAGDENIIGKETSQREDIMRALGVSKSYRPEHMKATQAERASGQYYNKELRKVNTGKTAMETKLQELGPSRPGEVPSEEYSELLDEYKSKYDTPEYRHLKTLKQVESAIKKNVDLGNEVPQNLTDRLKELEGMTEEEVQEQF